jgi:hypothetical protein
MAAKRFEFVQALSVDTITRKRMRRKITNETWELPRACEGLAFHGLFYGLRNFCCKTAHFCATRRDSEATETPSISNAAQRCENARKRSFLNYKYVGVLYSLGKVAAELYLNASKDETVMRALERSLGTSELEERNDLNPLIKLWEFRSYAPKDGKFAADVTPFGTFFGTKGTIETIESQILQISLEEMGQGSKKN